MRGWLPPRPFTRAILARTTWLWLGIHMAGAALSGAFTVNVAATLWVWMFTLAGVLLTTRRRGELLILANLEFSPLRIAGLVLAWCAVLDVALLFTASMVA